MRGPLRAALLTGWLALAAAGAAAGNWPETDVLSFVDLNGWEDDDHAAAFDTFLTTCPDLAATDWASLCAYAQTSRPEPRQFFELFFRPVLVGGPQQALFTAYYEPELRASPLPTAEFTVPVLAAPPELRNGEGSLPSRAEIDAGALDGRGLELGWLRNPAELYFLQLQGSGRLNMTDGRVLRLGYGGQNGHPRRPVSAELVRRGIYEPHQVSAAVIRNWVRRHPEEGRALLHHDPSYVFFRVLEGEPASNGPRGAMGQPLTPLRSLAVDPQFTPLGAPVWVERATEARLMVAQDTGGAIRGPQRGDIFLGTGAGAGRAAMQVRDSGRMVLLLPIEIAYARANGGS